MSETVNNDQIFIVLLNDRVVGYTLDEEVALSQMENILDEYYQDDDTKYYIVDKSDKNEYRVYSKFRFLGIPLYDRMEGVVAYFSVDKF